MHIECLASGVGTVVCRYFSVFILGGWKFFSFVKGWGSFFVSHSEGLGGLFCFVPIFFVFCSTTGSFSPTGRIVCVSIKSNILDIIIFLSKTNVFVFVIRNSDSVSLFTGGWETDHAVLLAAQNVSDRCTWFGFFCASG